MLVCVIDFYAKSMFVSCSENSREHFIKFKLNREYSLNSTLQYIVFCQSILRITVVFILVAIRFRCLNMDDNNRQHFPFSRTSGLLSCTWAGA